MVWTCLMDVYIRLSKLELCLDFLTLVGKQGRCEALVLLHDFVLWFVAKAQMWNGRLPKRTSFAPLHHWTITKLFGEPLRQSCGSPCQYWAESTEIFGLDHFKCDGDRWCRIQACCYFFADLKTKPCQLAADTLMSIYPYLYIWSYVYIYIPVG